MSIDLFLAELLQRIEAAVKKGVREAMGESRSVAAPEAGALPPPIAVPVAEVARLLSTPEPTVREWIKSGALPAKKTPGGRTYLVKLSDLDRFLRKSGEFGKVDIAAQVSRILGTGTGRTG